jgi:hypothetical protein
LVLAWTPTGGDVARGSTALTLNGNAARKAGPAGIAVSGITAINDFLALPDMTGVLGSRWSVAMVLRTASTNNQGFGDMSSVHASAEHYPFSGDPYITFGSETRFQVTFPSGVALTSPHCLVGAMDANGVGNNAYAYVNGAACNLNGYTPGGTNHAWTSGRYIGYKTGDFAAWDGEVYAIFAWNRQLPTSEAIEVSRNPWQLFVPLRRRLWVPSAGGAATHTTTGALAADAATVAGTATHLTLHATTGALAAQAATVSGTSVHPHTTTGALTAQAATLSGTAAHATLHTTTGALSAAAATVAGAAVHPHTTTGALAADAATVAGTAGHTATTHPTTGALQAGEAQISGTAAHVGASTARGGYFRFARRRNYIIAGKRYHDLTPEEVAQIVAELSLVREEVKVVPAAKKPHVVSKAQWAEIKAVEVYDDDEDVLLLL